MAQMSSSAPAPMTPEAFLADRERGLHRFWALIRFGAIAAAVVLILLAVFLL